MLNKLLSIFFNIRFKNNEIIRRRIKKISFKNIIRKNRKLKRFSTNKIIFSKPMLKHTNNEIVITIFTYNREKFVFIKKLQELLKKINIKFIKVLKFKNKFIVKSLKFKLRKRKIFNNFNFNLVLNKEKNKLNNKINNEKLFLFKTIKFNSLEKFSIKEFKNINKFYYLIHDYYKILLLNNYKFKPFFLRKIKNLISKIFNKNIEFRIINLKNYLYNSDIFIEILKIKLKNRKNRVNKTIKKVFNTVKISRFNKLNFIGLRKEFYKSENVNLIKKESLNKFLFNTFWKNKVKYLLLNRKRIRKTLYCSLKYKRISGVKLKAKGRLTKRLTASRSILLLKNKGNIRNIYSSYMGISTLLLKGYSKSNIQYSNINSKTVNGSFGLKGWINSY